MNVVMDIIACVDVHVVMKIMKRIFVKRVGIENEK